MFTVLSPCIAALTHWPHCVRLTVLGVAKTMVTPLIRKSYQNILLITNRYSLEDSVSLIILPPLHGCNIADVTYSINQSIILHFTVIFWVSNLKPFVSGLVIEADIQTTILNSMNVHSKALT